jgi:hypothetical protein
MAGGGFNLVWCGEKELDVAQRHGLRALLQEGLLAPSQFDRPGQREKLGALVRRVCRHPAMYAYFLVDEPNAGDFAAVGRVVTFLRQQDPQHLAYINLFPTYANNQQLGTQGDTISAYREHLREFIDLAEPSLLSYDHYQFAVGGDNPEYFLNLALVRQAAIRAGVPMLQIVQACTWTPSMRVPDGDQMRYLVYTTLAYGAQGISYYVYCCPGHTGGIARPSGAPTPLYTALATLNRQFVAVGRQLQPLRSLGVYHCGMRPPGAQPPAADLPFRVNPPLPAMSYKPPERVKGLLLGAFAAAKGSPSTATHVLVVNLDYRSGVETALVGPGKLETFDAAQGTWASAGASRVPLRLPPGGGTLVRLECK